MPGLRLRTETSAHTARSKFPAPTPNCAPKGIYREERSTNLLIRHCISIIVGEMDVITAYSIAFASLLGLYPLLWLLGLLSSAISPRAPSARDLVGWLSVYFDRYIRFMHVIPRKYWMNITMPEFLVLERLVG